MSENKTNEEKAEVLEEVIPAKLVDGESIIPEEKVEEVKAVVADLIKKKSVKEDEEASEDVITAPVPDDLVPGLGPVANGVMGTSLMSKTEKPKISKSKPKVDGVEKVAIFSTKNVSWAEANGRVYRGYNIVKKEAADLWLTKDFIRLATPEEVAKEYGL
jgi:hypothetical protein